jgi:nucleobase:cation symporter-1, NCS1 family
MLFWGVNMFVIYMGINSIRVLLNIKAPLLILLGLALLDWAYVHAHGFGPMLSQPSAFAPGQPKAGQFWLFFFAALTGMIGFWATLSLNIPDFSRYAYSQKQPDRRPGHRPADHHGPLFLHRRRRHQRDHRHLRPSHLGPRRPAHAFHNPAVLLIAMLSLCIATLATNLAANVVSPANDFSHLAPRFISFRTGGLITGLVGIAIQPWKLIADPSGYIFTWLVAYSALLGAVGGILIVDYFVIRRGNLNLAGLFRRTGPYWYSGGFNIRALIALALGIAPQFGNFTVSTDDAYVNGHVTFVAPRVPGR